MPDWLLSWLEWYTLGHDPDKRPANAPEHVPQWAFDLVEKVMEVHVELGPPAKYQAWRDWRLVDQGVPAKRPNVPAAIPDGWWEALKDDQAAVAALLSPVKDRVQDLVKSTSGVAALLSAALAKLQGASVGS
jgi:hypothetical protein